MHVLSVVHGEQVRAGVFGDAVEARGHHIDEWSIAWSASPPRPLDEYGAVLVFGGAMHADQDGEHPWLQEEGLLLQRLVATRKPLLGICLGAQLLAKATGAHVGPAREPEIGWYSVELTAAAEDDPLLGRLPSRFEAFQWHYYAHDLPAGAVELARNDLCTQAFRLGDSAWGVQFHPEVTLAQIESWITEDEPVPDNLLEETRRRISDWNALGTNLCDAFVDVAEQTQATRPHGSRSVSQA